MIIGIVAVDRNLAIGKDGRLPWHYSADMKFFKATTIGNAVVMGRRTWQTLEKPLPGRMNIVVTTNTEGAPTNSTIRLPDIGSVLMLAKTLTRDLFVIGGAKVYESFDTFIERWIVTEIPLSVEGADTFMPRTFLNGFELNEVRQLDEDLRVKFYERIRTGL
jgi:dihydrofolate reductase